MKLLNYLLSESKKGWKWPNNVVKAVAMKGDKVVNFYFDYTCPPSLSETLISPHPFTSSEVVTSQQYEAALADSKPKWDGVGLPPVGIEAEVSVDGGRTWCLYKATSEHNGMRLVEIGNFTEEFQSNNWTFRPIRSEEDKKRDVAIKAIDDAQSQIFDQDSTFSEYLYDAIAAGKIPHIRID